MKSASGIGLVAIVAGAGLVGRMGRVAVGIGLMGLASSIASAKITVVGTDAQKQKIADTIKYLKANSPTAKTLLERAESKPDEIKVVFGESIDVSSAHTGTLEVTMYESAINRIKLIDKPGGGGKALEAGGFTMIFVHETLGHIQNALDGKEHGEPEAMATENKILKELGLPTRDKYSDTMGDMIVIPFSDGSKTDVTAALSQDKTGKDGTKKKYTNFRASGTLNVIGVPHSPSGGVLIQLNPGASNSIQLDLTNAGGGLQQVPVTGLQAILINSQNPELNAKFGTFGLSMAGFEWFCVPTGTTQVHLLDPSRGGAGTTTYAGLPQSFEFAIGLDALLSNPLFTDIIGPDGWTVQVLTGSMTYFPSLGAWMGTFVLDGMGFAPTVPSNATWSDNFDSYPTGPLAGNGGWAIWCSGGIDGAVNTTFAHSGTKSFRADANTDMVQTFSGITSGSWVFSCMTYVPTGATGAGAMVLLNQYPCPTQNQQWSISTNIDASLGVVQEWGGANVPLVTGQWVEYRLEIDLDADTFNELYNGQALVTGGSWSNNIAPGGLAQLQALDLYSSTMNGMYYDTICLTQIGNACYPDCDGDSALSIDDFICFQTFFALGDDYADCDGDTALTIDDFICFQTFFAIGC